MRRKIVDRVISVLGWVPYKTVGVPLIVLLALGPAAYLVVVQARHSWRVGAAAAPRRTEAAPAVLLVGRGRALSPDDPFRAGFAVMTAELERAAQRYSGQVAIYLKDLEHGEEWAYHADDLFPSASLIKVPIMVGVFSKIDRGELALNSRLRLRRRTRMGGSGSIKWKRDGTRFTVRKLLEKLINESDNTAMRILIDEVGMGWMQDQFPKMGLVYTEIYPDGLSLKSGRVRYENYTTAREMTMLMEKIYRGEMVNRFASELMLELLKGRRHGRRSRLTKGLPVGWEIAHKTGLLRRACHDAAIIFSPNGDYILTVLTARNRSYKSGKNFITKAGRITYAHYRGKMGLYAKSSGLSSGSAR